MFNCKNKPDLFGRMCVCAGIRFAQPKSRVASFKDPENHTFCHLNSSIKTVRSFILTLQIIIAVRYNVLLFRSFVFARCNRSVEVAALTQQRKEVKVKSKRNIYI